MLPLPHLLNRNISCPTEVRCTENSVKPFVGHKENEPDVTEKKKEHNEETNGHLFAKQVSKGDRRREENIPGRRNRGEGGPDTFRKQINLAGKREGAYHQGFYKPLQSM